MARPTRAPTIDELYDIQAISSAAGLRFADHADRRIAARADDPPFTLTRLQAWEEAGRIWVTTDDVNGPVGFVVVDIVDGLGHVEEMSVHPDHQRAGHGSALLDAAALWCVATGRDAVTLTTFDGVEWNRPFYEGRGFRVLEDDEIGTELRARVRDEEEAGLDPDLRVCMRRDLS